ncbi:MAG: N-acetylglucosamine-6-phosphate deacetylase [Rhodobacteraceae bacterium]|nr:N-acetylglucosamine-6-phosphate deacetylase [Paracoccaceae bacterium]
MSGQITGYAGAAVFDGHNLLDAHVLLVQGGMVAGIVAQADVPAGTDIRWLDGGILAPGFVDLQVNGGGGMMFNTDPSVATLRVMAAAHGRLGATTILPTLITDHPEMTRAAIGAVQDAVTGGVAGIAGLHLEGPHLAVSRKGAHDGALIRAMDAQDLEILCAAAQTLPVLKVTLAPENVTFAQMRVLASAGVILSLGHTDAGYDNCVAAADAGVVCVTHLFNAMSQLGSREPGVVGAALKDGRLSAGLIGDLVHVHGGTIRLALAAKQGPGRIFLVSDAMAVAGTNDMSFTLNGRKITRRDGRLTLDDGTLAGADLDLATAVGNLCATGVEPAQALAMATTYPGEVLAPGGNTGKLCQGTAADFVHLSDTMELRTVWRAGLEVARI